MSSKGVTKCGSISTLIRYELDPVLIFCLNINYSTVYFLPSSTTTAVSQIEKETRWGLVRFSSLLAFWELRRSFVCFGFVHRSNRDRLGWYKSLLIRRVMKHLRQLVGCETSPSLSRIINEDGTRSAVYDIFTRTDWRKNRRINGEHARLSAFAFQLSGFRSEKQSRSHQ